MDISLVEALIPNVAGMLGIEPATALLIVGVVVSVCNLLGRLIPDDATGWLGVVRKVCKFVGLYTSNRVSSGVSVNDVTKAMLDAPADSANTIEEIARKL